MAQLVKERARSPIIETAVTLPATKTVNGELHYAIEISEPWKEGGKHAQYGLILSKAEAMGLMSDWLKTMAQQEVARRRDAATAAARDGERNA
jgi:hypothetical protein